jgi:hypothetical protein
MFDAQKCPCGIFILSIKKTPLAWLLEREGRGGEERGRKKHSLVIVGVDWSGRAGNDTQRLSESSSPSVCLCIH